MMQKTLRKPENWQDFESLCKKLWGEIWHIPHKIKKNGRLGQPQNGVDVYGIPSGEIHYWGIQCKGKNDYLNTKLTTKEIDLEIEKAKNFKPELAVFIIATTQNKDVEIEEYIRVQDIENRKINNFEILLFCWEDIVDLIEENRECLNWYLGINNYREKYEVSLNFENSLDNIKVIPKFLKEITKSRPLKPIIKDKFHPITIPKISSPFQPTHRNLSWINLKLRLSNTGNVVLENWYLKIKLDNVRKISDNFSVDIFMSDSIKKMLYENKCLFAYEEKNEFLYEPSSKEPIIQKSSISFQISFIPNFDSKEINISWDFLARDYDKSGTLKIYVEPEYIERIKYIELSDEYDKLPDTIEIKELLEEIE